MVVLNSMNDARATFGYDTNKISIIKKNGLQKNFSLKNKNEVARDIVNEVELVLLQNNYETVRAERLQYFN